MQRTSKKLYHHFIVVIPRLRDLPRPVRMALATVLGILVLLLIFPFKTVVVPSWPVRVVDETGRPIPGIYVTEHWQHYMLDDYGQEEMRSTDSYGAVEFSERSIRSSVVQRLWTSVSKFAREGFLGRWDCYGSVVVWGSREHSTTTAVLQEGSVPPEKIVVKRTFTYSNFSYK